ncbi:MULTISPECIES: hypothetical protein [unclassified Streptomyces]|uniref:hypothetical protein n=1 Tax=unclassified Streptomyces TaxID=2593676 RepID=UPI0030773E88
MLSSEPGSRCGISITPGRPPARASAHQVAFVDELLVHPLKDTFGDSKFVALGPHLRQLLGQLETH